MYFNSAVLLICLDLHELEMIFKLEGLFHQHRKKKQAPRPCPLKACCLRA